MYHYRKYLKNHERSLIFRFKTLEEKGLPIPPVEKEWPSNASLIFLTSPNDFSIGSIPLLEAINGRRSRRDYSNESLSKEEISFLLWVTQGVREITPSGKGTYRNVPSGGCLHPFETYLIINRVESIKPGLYRYIATKHALLELNTEPNDWTIKINNAVYKQKFIGSSAAIFIWSVRPNRTEWRYNGDSLKDILTSVGHICQNLYLGCEAIHSGTCAIQAYHQNELDALVGIDGKNEIAIYLAPVGK
jgi:SagB-type dehydrogenase family enzyme